MTTLLRTMMQQTAFKLLGTLVLFIAIFGVIFLSNIEDASAQQTCFTDPDTGQIHCSDTPTPVEPPPINNDDQNNSGGGGGTEDNNVNTAQTVVMGTGIINNLYGFVIQFGGSMVKASGELLDFAVQNFILKFGEIYLTWGVGVAVEQGWSTIRDVLNLSFIFALVYIGLKLIFNADDSSAKRSLGSLLIAALLINFSLFVSKFVIDMANSLASIIYYQGLPNATAGISSVLLGMLGTSTIFDVPVLSASTSTVAGLTIVFGTLIFLLVTAYVFFAFAIMIFVRSIVLFFLMIFSPLMFIGFIFSDFKKYSDQYMAKLLGQAFVAPAAIFMLYLSILIMTGFKFQFNAEQDGSLGYLFTDSDYARGAQALMVFSLGVGMLLISLQVAKRMGAVGATTAISIGNSMRKSAQGSIQSFVGRNTVGRLASGVGWLNDKADAQLNRSVAGRIINQNVLAQRSRQNIINSGKNAKFGGSYSRADDKEYSKKQREAGFSASKNATINSTINNGVKALAVDPASRTDDDRKAIRELNSLVPTLGKTRIEEMSDKNRKAVAHLFTASQIKDFEKSDKVSDASKSELGTARTAAIKAKVETGGKTDPAKASKISKQEIEALGSGWIAQNAHLLTPSQFDEIKKSDTFNPEEKSFFITERNRLLTELAQPSKAAELKDYLQAIKDKQKEIANLPINVLNNITTAEFINSKVIKEIDKNTDISRSDKLNIARKIRLLGAGLNDDGKNYLATPKMMNPTESEWI